MISPTFGNVSDGFHNSLTYKMFPASSSHLTMVFIGDSPLFAGLVSNDAHNGSHSKTAAYNKSKLLTNLRGIMPALDDNENYLHLLKKLGNITNFHLSYFFGKPQQPAHLSPRSRMVALFKFVAYKPSTPSSSFGVLGFLLVAGK